MTINSNTFVDSIDRAFGKLAVWAVKRRLIVVLAALVLLIGGGYFAGKVKVDNSVDAFFNKSDPTYLAYTDYLEEFLSDEVIYILYRVPDSEHGPFDLAAMHKIAQLTEALENEVPFARKVTSLANIKSVYPKFLDNKDTISNVNVEFTFI